MKFIKKILNIPSSLLNFLKGLVYELKQVEYLKGRKALNYTLLVIGFLVFGTLFILAVDTAVLRIRDILFSL